MIDCVLGYHLNPLTCGIAKFNKELAVQLNVPLLSVFDQGVGKHKSPVLSIKISEFTENDMDKLNDFVDGLLSEQDLVLFYHAYDGTKLENKLINRASIVYCGNVELYNELSKFGSKIIEAWCPGTLLDDTPFNDAEISVMTFGMAHKMRPDFYHKLDRLLKDTGKSYCLYVSTALHEGTTFEENFLDVFDEMKSMFSGEVYFLGFLSDTAVYNYIKNTTYLAAFFQSGVRANNTSVNTAMECGATIITNLDNCSPACFKNMDTIIDINDCNKLPDSDSEIKKIGSNAMSASAQLGWKNLIEHVTSGEKLMRELV